MAQVVLKIRFEQILWDYYIELSRRLERKLAKVLDEEKTPWEIVQPDITIDGDKVRFVLPIEIDISEITMEEQPCEYIEDIEYRCGTSLEDDPDCDDPDSPRCTRKFRKCVDEHIEEFKREHSKPPFTLRYSNNADIEAEVRSYAVDHGDKLCAHDFLLVRYVWEPPVDYLPVLERDMEHGRVNIDYVAERIAAYVKSLIEVIEVLGS